MFLSEGRIRDSQFTLQQSRLGLGDRTPLHRENPPARKGNHHSADCTTKTGTRVLEATMDSASPGNQHQPTTSDEFDPAAIVQALKTKRKPRTTKSCFPCRHRKVRCDGNVPCSNCVRREHAELCRTAGASGVGKGSPQLGVRKASERWESPAESLDEGVAHRYSYPSSYPH